MPTVDQLLSDDALLLSLEPSTLLAATNFKSIIGMPYSVNTVHVDSLFGNAYAGSFFAGPLVSGQRQVIALVTDSAGAVSKLTGTLSVSNDGLGTGVITATPLSGAWNQGFPHYIGLVSTASTSIAGTVDGVAWSSTVGFTLELSGQILLRLAPDTDVCTAKFFTCRTFQGNSITMMPYSKVHPPEQVEVTDGLGPSSLWAAPQHRQFNGGTKDVTAVVDVDDLATLTYQDEKHTHAIIGAQFGDLEFDIGKSVPWVRYFTDDVFIADINSGDPRYWVIDWDKTFPKAKFLSLGVDYFTNPVGWRKAQFAAADAAWHYSDNDWVLFMDGSEGLSCDTRSQPNDVVVNPFRSYLHREITRAEGLGKTTVCFPWMAFVRNADKPDPRRFYQITDVTLVQDNPVDIPLADINVAVIHVAVPYYVQMDNFTQRGLVRLVKVSTIRNPSFNWASIDTPSTPDDNVKMQVITYAYAKWKNPATGTDDGMKMRTKMNPIRPMDGLPLSGTDRPGAGGPYTVAQNGVLTPVPGEVPQTDPLLTPMYSSLFRVNPQDGVWYVRGDIAPEVTPPPYAFAFPPPIGFGLAHDATVSVDQ